MLRVWTADKLFPHLIARRARLKYMFSFMAIIDLLAILPFYAPFIISFDLRFLRTFRLLRLIRLLKLNRYTTALATLNDVIRGKATQILSSMLVVGLLMVISSLLMYAIENDEQPEVFVNAFTGFYWAIETLTTVSYGDIFPVTPLGRVLGAVISLLGLSLVAVPTGILSAGFMENIEREKEKAKEKEDKHFCPYCGKNLDE
jgi:voltage-gated potassium channel